MHAGLGAAGEHRVGVAAPDQLGRLADRVRAGRARRDRRVVRAAEAERDRELPARGVDEHARDERRRDAVRPALAQHLRLLHDPEEAADRACRRGCRRVPGRRRRRASRRRPPPGRRRARAGRYGRACGPPCARRPCSGRSPSPRPRSARKAARVEGADEVDPAPALDAARQVDGASLPIGVTAPSPVTTTLLTRPD